MLKVAKNTLREVDAILLMVDSVDRIGKQDRYILEMLKGNETPVFLVMNKIDLIHPDKLLSVTEAFRKEYDFADVIPISALEGINIDGLLEVLTKHLPEGPQYYPADQVTDHPERFIISELIREKVLHLTHEEIPHSIAVVIEKIKREEDSEKIRVTATIMVERESQKGMVIGKKGALLKEVKMRARKDIEMLLGSKVYLELWVKVQRDWRNKQVHLRDFGFRDDEY